MVMAETLVRHQMGWDEVPMKDLLRRYGAVLEEDLKKDQDRGKTTEESGWERRTALSLPPSAFILALTPSVALPAPS
jgi:hypothetical protein